MPTVKLSMLLEISNAEIIMQIFDFSMLGLVMMSPLLCILAEVPDGLV